MILKTFDTIVQKSMGNKYTFLPGSLPIAKNMTLKSIRVFS